MEKTLNNTLWKSTAKTLLLSVAALACATPALAQTTINQNGDLGPGDETLRDGEFYDTIYFEGRAGDPIDVTLSSSQFDTFLVLSGPDGFGVGNDDDEGGGTTNSRITATLPSTGSYTLALTSLSGGETGRYQVRGSYGSGSGSNTGAQQQPLSADELTGVVLVPGRPVSGSLASSDRKFESGEFYDIYTVAAETADIGSQVIIRVSSNAFDTQVVATDRFNPRDYSVENDDDPNGNGTTNSLLEATFPASGLLTIFVSSFEAGATGEYTLVVDKAGGAASGGFRKK